MLTRSIRDRGSRVVIARGMFVAIALAASACVGDRTSSSAVAVEQPTLAQPAADPPASDPPASDPPSVDPSFSDSTTTVSTSPNISSADTASPDTASSSPAPADSTSTNSTSTSTTTTLPVAPSAPIDVSAPIELVFGDEFDDDTLDEVWTTCYWWQLDGGCTISSNDEQQWYRPEGVDLADGLLRLEVSEREQRTTDGDRLPYRSGMVSTGPVEDDAPSSFQFTYGIVETRVRFPEGDGLWPAVWLLSADRTSLPEIDLVEWYGSRSRVVTSHVHQRIDGERASGRVEADFDESLAGDWHVVAAHWSSDGVVFYFDGVETGRVADPALIPQTPMYVIINLAAGGQAGEVDEGALPQSLYIDYVRIWQETDR